MTDLVQHAFEDALEAGAAPQRFRVSGGQQPPDGVVVGWFSPARAPG
ncbi:hypothetical protein [Streptomyces heilongjiangensis]|uniref:Uncharacterized protein n=1 Tax=Streptomyces heilongjiangensis TaxID=945052 RepID=A0ABW1BJA3_9ACTN|nr:hypothetical protein [Streptomyces heilongjiangensis]MDC2951779.1 hypothetical protein [Streptomyces heilongjiangensis]